MKLFVAKLNRDAGESDLLEWFGAMGPVKSAKVVVDRDTGQSKCFGFVEMESRDGGERALAEMNGQEFMGFRMVVKEAEDRPAKPRDGVTRRGAPGQGFRSDSASGRGASGSRPEAEESSHSSDGKNFRDAPKSRKPDKKKSGKDKPDKYSDGPRDVKLKRKPKGGGGRSDWGAFDDDF